MCLDGDESPDHEILSVADTDEVQVVFAVALHVNGGGPNATARDGHLRVIVRRATSLFFFTMLTSRVRAPRGRTLVFSGVIGQNHVAP